MSCLARSQPFGADSPRPQRPVEVEGGADQGEVSKRLGIVAQGLVLVQREMEFLASGVSKWAEIRYKNVDSISYYKSRRRRQGRLSAALLLSWCLRPSSGRVAAECYRTPRPDAFGFERAVPPLDLATRVCYCLARSSSSIEVEELSAEGDDMPSFSADVLRRYGCAILLVALAVVSRLGLYPILGNRYPFFLFFIAIVLAAGYGGHGPSLLALVLSWLSVDYLLLGSGANPSPFESKSQIAFGFFVVGLAVTVLGGFWRSARERAKASSLELQQAFEVQKAERDWHQISLASIADAVITTDPEGFVIFLNPVACRLTGWRLDEAVRRPLKEVFRTVQKTTQRINDLPIAKVVGSGEVILSDDEVVLIAKDGAARSIEHNAAPIRDSNGKIKGVVIVFRDVTERHRAEQAQKESDDRFHQLADHISDVFWIYELDGLQDWLHQPCL